jgi:hypothetical protein
MQELCKLHHDLKTEKLVDVHRDQETGAFIWTTAAGGLHITKPPLQPGANMEPQHPDHPDHAAPPPEHGPENQRSPMAGSNTTPIGWTAPADRHRLNRKD